jgi:CheY-like chemotaxis protein
MSGPRVLVIQANHENGMELDRLLRSFGCPVATCDSLSTGLARLASEQSAGQTPDLAIIDMTMPSGPGGLEAAQLLRMVEPSIRVAVSSDHRVAGHVAHGFVAALKRPYTSEAVGVVIEQVRTQLTLA